MLHGAYCFILDLAFSFPIPLPPSHVFQRKIMFYVNGRLYCSLDSLKKRNIPILQKILSSVGHMRYESLEWSFYCVEVNFIINC